MFTVGWPEGSSPISAEEADAYFSNRGIAAWTGDPAVKEAALTRATDYVRALFAPRFDPAKFVDAFDNDIIPDALKMAVAEYGLIELGTVGGLAPAPVVDQSGYAVVRTKKKVGPIESNYTVVPGSERQVRRIFPVPDALIASLMLPSTGLTRVVR